MKKILISIFAFFFLINTSNACMPFTTESIVIWEYNGTIEKEFPYSRYEEGEYQFIDFKNVEKPFSNSYKKLWKHYFYETDRVDLSDYNKWDLIITISDYDNWDYETYFQLYEVWKISCKNTDEFYIENKQWFIDSFWKEMWQCGNYVNYDAWSEQDLLEKIKQKYKTCENIGIKKASYIKNTQDDLKINKLEDKIWKIIEKSNNKVLLKTKIKARLIKLLWKNKTELNQIINISEYTYSTFKEYALIELYTFISK